MILFPIRPNTDSKRRKRSLEIGGRAFIGTMRSQKKRPHGVGRENYALPRVKVAEEEIQKTGPLRPGSPGSWCFIFINAMENALRSDACESCVDTAGRK